MGKTLLIISFLGSAACAQVDSLRQMLDFYPLQTGNYWEYAFESDSYMDMWSIYRSAYSVEVVGDTTMSNGFSYKKLRHVTFYPNVDSNLQFVRIDSSTGCIYKWVDNQSSGAYEVKMDSLYSQTGDTVTASWDVTSDGSYGREICDSVSIGTEFGVRTEVRYMRSQYFTVNSSYSLARGIGLLGERSGYDFGVSTSRLVYAKINGTEYADSAVKGSLADLMEYYPLQTGDYWEYKTDSYDCVSSGPCQEDTSAFSLEVSGDTLPNRNYYKVLRYTKLFPGHSTFVICERIDPSTGCVFRFDTGSSAGEIQVDSLFARPGDSFSTTPKMPFGGGQAVFRAEVGQTFADTILGTPTQLRQFNEASLYENGYSLAKGLGMTHVSDTWDFGHSYTTLVYAKISGVEYGTKIILGVEEAHPVPSAIVLCQNYPNPFNPATAIRYQISAVSQVSLKIYDVLGREVATIVHARQSPGYYEVSFDAGRLSSGVYFYRLEAGNYTSTKKMLLIK